MRDLVLIEGVPFDRITPEGVVARVIAALTRGQGGMIVTPNLQFIHRARQDPGFRSLLSAADISVADGMPVVWASRLARNALPQRIGGVDLLVTVCAALAPLGGKVFLLGGRPGMAAAAADRLAADHPGLIIAGACCPPIGFEQDATVVAEINATLVQSRADLVLVALGMPRQEEFIAARRDLLPATWWMGIGGSFEMIAGGVARAPLWMQRCGLEWMHRLGREPRRLARRYLLEGIPTAVAMLIRAAWRGRPGAR